MNNYNSILYNESYDRKDVNDMVVALKNYFKNATEGSLSSDLRWRPNLIINEDPITAIHIHAESKLSDFWFNKLKQAKEKTGCKLFIASPINLLGSSSTLRDLNELSATVVPLEYDERGSWTVKCVTTVPRLIYQEKWILDQKDASNLAVSQFERLKEIQDINLKGKALEDLLAFLFSQIRDFEVIHTNYRTKTQEIDIVIKNKAIGGAIWGSMNSPIILIEAKNWNKPIPRYVLTDFREKVHSRKGATKLGFLITTGKFSEDLLNHELRYSFGDIVIVLIDGQQLYQLCNSTNLLETLESYVTECVLR